MTQVRWVVLLAVAAVLASANAYLVASSKISLDSDPSNVHSTRRLRIVDDEERAGVPASLLEKAKTVLLPSVTTGKLVKWATKGKPVDEVFVRLGLKKVALEKLFETPQFFTWAKYVDDVGEKAPAKAPTMIPTLVTQYGDDALARIIAAAAASKNLEVKQLASKVQAEQFYTWVAKGKTPDEVFNILNLNKAGSKLVSSPELDAMRNYVKAFNTQKPSEQTTLIATMIKSYGDDVVASMLEAARKVPATAKDAKTLESELVKHWMKVEPDDVFKLLKLDTAAENMFNTAQLNAWGKYVDEFNALNPDKKTSLIAAMTKSYGDAGAVALLEAAKKLPGSAATATRLQREQLKYWLSVKQPPKDVFRAFKLNKAGDKLLESPYYSAWMKYTDDFFGREGDLDSAAFKALRTYSDEELAKMILAAENNPSLKKAVEWTDKKLIRGWMAKSSPTMVFNGLRLDAAGETVFQAPLFGYFTKYMARATEGMKNPDEVMLMALTGGLGDEVLAKALITAKKTPSTEKLATTLQAEQLKYWLSQKDMTPEKLFKQVLFLDEADVFTNPLLNTWATYLKAFNANKPLKEQASMINTLRDSFRDDDLAKLLTVAKEAPETKKMATNLETALLNRWILDKESPTAVSNVLTSGGVKASAKAQLLETYTAKFKETYG